MTTPADVAAAQARAAAARERLNLTVSQLQTELAPRNLAREVADAATTGARSLASASIKTAMRNPAATGGGIAAAILMVCRKPLARALGLTKQPPSAAKPPHLRRVERTKR